MVAVCNSARLTKMCVMFALTLLSVFSRESQQPALLSELKANLVIKLRPAVLIYDYYVGSR